MLSGEPDAFANWLFVCFIRVWKRKSKLRPGICLQPSRIAGIVHWIQLIYVFRSPDHAFKCGHLNSGQVKLFFTCCQHCRKLKSILVTKMNLLFLVIEETLSGESALYKTCLLYKIIAKNVLDVNVNRSLQTNFLYFVLIYEWNNIFKQKKCKAGLDFIHQESIGW